MDGFEPYQNIGGSMLILSRRMGESIQLGDSVTVTVLGVTRGQVKIGIAAPREVTVHREEVYRRIQEEKSNRAGPCEKRTNTSQSDSVN